MTETPRTDALLSSMCHIDVDNSDDRIIQHARQLERELDEARRVYSAERHHLRTVNENLIRHLSHILGLMHPKDVVSPNGKRFVFRPPDELVREAWEGLSKAIREIPDVLDAARSQKEG